MTSCQDPQVLVLTNLLEDSCIAKEDENPCLLFCLPKQEYLCHTITKTKLLENNLIESIMYIMENYVICY
jgi:hypothetical protein